MKGKIINNFSLKILSIICAIILWAVIINIYDPTASVTFPGITVTLDNVQSLTDKDYTFEVIDGNKISVYISGPRSVVSKIKSTDIIATADLSEVTVFSNYVDIDVKVAKDGVTRSNLEVIPKTTAIKLSIENRVSKVFNIQYQMLGTPANGYVILNSRISPTTVKLTGSASSINSIYLVKAEFDVSGTTMDINATANLVLYDSEDNVISSSNLEMSKVDVDFKATVVPTKTIQLKFSTIGEVAAGYKLTGVDYSSKEIVVAGKADALKGIDSIEIAPGEINLDKLEADKEFQINLNEYLPSNITIISDNKITATAKISQIVEKPFTIGIDKIAILNAPNGYNVSYGDLKEVKINLVGTANILNSITAADLKPTINILGFGEGKKVTTLNFTLPVGLNLKQNYEVEVTLTNTKPPTNENITESTTASTETQSTTAATTIN